MQEPSKSRVHGEPLENPNQKDLASQKFYAARIVQRRSVAEDLWSIRVRPPAEIPFLPGQYATLGVVAAHKHIERPYSIVSSPYEAELEFFFELVPRGELTPALYKLQVGDELTIRKAAKGRFTLDREVHQPVDDGKDAEGNDRQDECRSELPVRCGHGRRQEEGSDPKREQ